MSYDTDVRIANGLTLRGTIKRRKAEARDKKGTVRCFGTKLLLGKRPGLGYVLFTGMVSASTFKRATAPNCGARWLQLGDFYMAQARALQRASGHVPGKGFTVD